MSGLASLVLGQYLQIAWCLCSVLMHGLPGLALFMHRHFPPPATAVEGLRHAASYVLTARWQLDSSACSAADAAPRLQQQDTSTSLVWSFLLPLAFYALWQLVYFLIVQVGPRIRLALQTTPHKRHLQFFLEPEALREALEIVQEPQRNVFGGRMDKAFGHALFDDDTIIGASLCLDAGLEQSLDCWVCTRLDKDYSSISQGPSQRFDSSGADASSRTQSTLPVWDKTAWNMGRSCSLEESLHLLDAVSCKF